ncbi:hypothetical protein SAMN06265368_3290 [Cohaesibacter gelatinilyticus]|uniref:Uncharacterized protein n=1 Tax=Cohaesibacter gelatinilyticus TaxID=372072 RepID=A0A285PG10_9HYPH|nr:hypothetical protein SAMN06265368_3290 [Cohaesibacter gelatinilyticus]
MVNVDQDLFYMSFRLLSDLRRSLIPKIGTFNGHLRDIDGLDFYLHRYG